MRSHCVCQNFHVKSKISFIDLHHYIKDQHNMQIMGWRRGGGRKTSSPYQFWSRIHVEIDVLHEQLLKFEKV